MKAFSLKIFVIYALASLSGIALLYTSQKVQQAEGRLGDIKRAVEEEQEAIRVLRAEWAYLNSPARLELLAEEFLAIEPNDPARMMPRQRAFPAANFQEAGTDHGEPQEAMAPAIEIEAEKVTAPSPVILHNAHFQSGQAGVLDHGETVAPAPPAKPSPPSRKPPAEGKSFDDLLHELSRMKQETGP